MCFNRGVGKKGGGETMKQAESVRTVDNHPRVRVGTPIRKAVPIGGSGGKEWTNQIDDLKKRKKKKEIIHP